jgi:gluconokinase
MHYFPRMLDKIRLFAKGEFHPDFHANLGRGADGFCTQFLRVDYVRLKERVLAGGTDEEILEWCFKIGRELNANDIWIWNQGISRLGWRDLASPRLKKLKEQSGLAHQWTKAASPDSGIKYGSPFPRSARAAHRSGQKAHSDFPVRTASD